MKKVFISSMLLLVLMKVGHANTVTVEKAKSVATNQLKSLQNGSLSKNGDLELELVTSQNLQTAKVIEPSYYIFKNKTGHGFVIVAGDDAVTPILGYSDENDMDVNNLPPNFVEFMNAHEREIQYVKANHIAATEEIKNSWAKISSTSAAVYPIITPLIQTKWSQKAPYNMLCPTGTPTGCVATAMAQIMRYWNYPAVGSGSHNDADFGHTTYDWKSMTDTYSSSSSAAEKSAVAILMSHVGLSVDMDYDTDGSGTKTYKAVEALCKYFRYSPTPTYTEQSDHVYEQWVTMFKQQLNYNTPLLMCGKKSSGGGHAWVCDGYDSGNNFHMNWGWGGSYNGYFQLNNLCPSDKNYNYEPAVIIGIRKPTMLTLKNVKTSVNLLCKSLPFTYSVDNNPKFAAYLWTIPIGWQLTSVSGNSVLSTGTPISTSSGSTVTITPPSNFISGSSATLTVCGVTSYGERTGNYGTRIGTGVPGYQYLQHPSPGDSWYEFIATPGAIIQYSATNSGWSNGGNVYTVDVTYPKKVIQWIRASNTCGASASKQYTFTSPKDVNCMGCKTIGETMESELALYPSPASERVFIQANQNIKNINCYNAFGQSVAIKFEGTALLISALPKGIYFLNITTEDGETVGKKFIKE